MEQKDVAADWRQRGFSCGLWTDPPGQVWEDFVHETDEIVMVVDGHVEFEIGGIIHRPRSGEELLIRSGVKHSVRNVGSSTAHWLYGYRESKA